MNDIVTLADIYAAQARIQRWVHRTPVLTSALLNKALGCELHFKCENFQKVGAFKARGAINAVAQLTGVDTVATHSSGNHGAALAYAAQVFGLKAIVVMPDNAPAVKQAAVAAYGGQIVTCRPTLADREAALVQVVEDTGAHFVPPYDHNQIIAGQGTAMLELLMQVAQPLSAVLVPVGGGGLLAGTAVAAKGCRPELQVIGTEPAGADDATVGFNRGQRVTQATPNTVADGLRTLVGVRNFDLICANVDAMLTVTEPAIVEAMALLWTRLKIIVEPSSAVPVAAIMEHAEGFKGQRVGVILSGGNVDLAQLPF